MAPPACSESTLEHTYGKITASPHDPHVVIEERHLVTVADG